MALTYLVTGASGFVGSHLCAFLQAMGHKVIKGDRAAGWENQLNGVDVVVHLAAKVHVLQASSADDAEFERDNVQASVSLAQAAAAAGVRRFVFISTIGVHGNESAEPLTEQSAIAPAGGYAQSKWRAEQALADVQGIEIVTLRPPLIYGAGVKANFLSLLRGVYHQKPLPFGKADALRDYISVTNFCHTIDFVSRSQSAHGTYLVCDGEPISTAALCQSLAALMNKPSRLLPIPLFLLKLGASLLGKRALFGSVCGARQIDDSKLRQLGWQPLQPRDAALKATADWYVNEQKM